MELHIRNGEYFNDDLECDFVLAATDKDIVTAGQLSEANLKSALAHLLANGYNLLSIICENEEREKPPINRYISELLHDTTCLINDNPYDMGLLPVEVDGKPALILTREYLVQSTQEILDKLYHLEGEENDEEEY